MKITPLGAAKEVTGSMFLIEYNEKKMIVDCGLFQGGYDAVLKNSSFPFDAKEIDAVVLTHAHLDHSGRVPMLGKFGYNNPIYATVPTCDLLSGMLLDSAKIQMEDYERKLRKNPRRGLNTPILMYDTEDVYYILRRLNPMDYDDVFEPIQGLKVTFRQGGHILGAASIEITNSEGKKVYFSGDIGGFDRNIVNDPDFPPECDFIFCESTYGNRLHRSYQASVDELAEAINEALKNGGNVIIPTFALERAQDLLYVMRELSEAGRIPNNPIFLDSPLAVNITKLYNEHIDDLNANANIAANRVKDPFVFENVHVVKTGNESRALNTFSGIIILAGSGMATGGRIKHHLKHNLWKSNSSIVFVGYQAQNTLGRKIVDGAEFVEIEGERIAVRANIYTINGFSAHADRDELAKWLKYSKHATIVLNHGEHSVIEIFKDYLEKEYKRTVIIADTEHPINI